jgi:outer membrane protein assembly factor BamB
MRRWWTLILMVAALTPPLAVSLRSQAPKAADAWSRFRGPNGSGVAEVTGIPAEFGPDRNVLWKTALPPGHSSPVLEADRLFLTGIERDSLLTLCLDRENGRVLWRRDVRRPRALYLDKRNGPAAPTPVTDGRAVYVFFQDVGLISYDLDGTERWRVSLGPFSNVYGMAASPVIVDGKLILVCDQSVGSFMLAVDSSTGHVVWRTERPEAKTGHSTPVVYQPPGGAATQIIVPGSFFLTAYSVETGQKLWWVSGLAFEMKATPVMSSNAIYINGTSSTDFQDSYNRAVPTFDELAAKYHLDHDGRFAPAEIPDELARRWLKLMDLNGDGYLDRDEWEYFRAARASRGGLWAFRPGGHGDMTSSSLVWHYYKAVPQLPSVLLYRHVLYTVGDRGIVTSLEPESGHVIAQRRIQGALDNFFASPVAADGKLFLVSESCKVAVLASDGSLKPLTVNDLDDMCYATPAISEGRIYIRTWKTLYCFGLRRHSPLPK